MLKKSLLASAIALSCATSQADVIISEYVEGSSNNKAVELYNTSSERIDLSQYALHFYFNGSNEIGSELSLNGMIEPNDTFVIAHSSAVAELKEKAQLDMGGGWFNGDDAITLVKSGDVIDSLGQIGFDPGSQWGSGEVSTKNRTLVRLATVASGRTDATSVFDPQLQWMALPQDDFSHVGIHLADTVEPEPVECDVEATLISAIQGSGDVSPLAGEQVVVQGVVTHSLQGSDQLNGFFLQEETVDYDAQASTSEGIFVAYHQSAVNVGDVVTVSAKVEEKYGQTQLGFVTDIKTCGSAAVEVTNVSLPQADGLEAYEGMLVQIDNEMQVTDTYGLARYGEVKLATERLYQATQLALPGEAANALEWENQQKEIVLDDGSTVQNPEVIPYPNTELDAYNTLRLGDRVTGITGALGFGYGMYRIQPVETPIFIQENPRTEAPAVAEQGNLRIASFNVLNYFNGDGLGGGYPTARGADTEEEFNRQKAKIVNAIVALDADVIGVMELENDGFDQHSAIADLVAALNAAQATDTYAFVDFNAAQIGDDEITVAMIYRTNKVAQVGQAAFTTTASFDGVNRPPVMQSFKSLDTNDVFSVVALHFKSKGGCSRATGLNLDQGDGQGCWNQARVDGVNQLAQWLNTNPTGVNDEDIVIIGDINAYGQEDPMYALETHGFSNVKKQMQNNTQDYSYVFKGRIGSLDHGFASSSMMARVVKAQDWHINADEPKALDYNVEYKSDKHQASLYAEHVYRASDHDPVVIDFNFATDSTTFEGQFDNLSGWYGWQSFEIELPEGFDNLTVSIEGEGEADLYVRQGQAPSYFSYDCRPRIWGSEEVCSFDAPASGKWFMRLRGFLPYQNVTLKYKATKAQ